MDYRKILEEIYSEIKSINPEGKIASYIPELAEVNPDKFGIHLTTLQGEEHSLGDSHEKFSIQSISKVLSLTLALSIEGEKIWKRVGVEPSGNPFNSLSQLEYEKGIPRNPFINSGAFVIADMLISNLKDAKSEYLEFVRRIAGNSSIQYNEKVALSEKKYGYRNVALINYMKSFGNINNDVEAVLDFYFHICSVEMSCKELGSTFLFYANQGKLPHSGTEILSGSKTKRLNALMQTCGFYDEAGEFTFRVGLPGKSGVGGGIIAIHPGELSVAVWSPRLNEKGNSFLGMKALELLTSKTGLSIF